MTTARPRPHQPTRTPVRARPLRILHVLDHSLPLHSGYTFRTLSLLQGQRALGWETFHLTSPKQGSGTLREETCDSWHFYRTPPARGLGARLPVWHYRALMDALHRRLEEVVQQVRPDILHAHSPVLNALPTLAVGRRLDIPVVYEVRAFWEDAAADLGTAAEGSARYRLTRALETRALRRADAVTTICEGLRTDMLARGIGPDKITVIPNAVDVTRFTCAAVPDPDLVSRYNLTPGKTLGFAGSFYAYEGLDLLLQALPAVLQAEPATRVLLVGGGPCAERLQTLTHQLGLDHAVHFTGRVPHEEVGRYYSVMDIMVYPRIARRLTNLVTPLKPLEAMAQGKLVVASDVGGHRELITDGKTGHLFAAGSADALAQCLLAQLGHRQAWPRVLQAGRQFVEHERTWSASVERYRAVYAALVPPAQEFARGR